MLKWMEYQREAAPTDSWQGAMEDYISLREASGNLRCLRGRIRGGSDEK